MGLEVTPMDIKMLLATLPEGTNLAEWCRKLGVSRQTAYKWRRRYAAEGPEGLAERSRATKAPHGKTSAVIEDLVVAKRKQLGEQGLDHGPSMVRDWLAAEHGIVLSDATAWRILSRRGQINPRPDKRPRSSWRRFARERPNECWQGDDTHYFLASGQEVRIINLLDDHSRLNVDSRASILCRSVDIWASFCEAVSRHGIPAEFLNDNGKAWISPKGVTPVLFQAQLARLGVHQIHSSSHHPQTCGKVERFHQTQRRWLDAHPQADTVAELQGFLDEFRELYNDLRPHRGIGRKTPASVWAAKEPATPPTVALQLPPTIANCTVNANGLISPGAHLLIGLGAEWQGWKVTVIRRGDAVTVVATETGEIIRELVVDPARRYQGSGRPRGGPAKPRRRPLPEV